jgi:hypothetical protein
VSFKQKNLQVNFTLASGNFGGGGGNSLSLTNLRMTAEISAVPGTAGSMLNELVIYGMSLDQMNQLTVIGKQLGTVGQNQVDVYAQDGDEQPNLVFTGDIYLAYVDGRDQPNLRFMVYAAPGGKEARKPMAPTTKKGGYAAEKLASSLSQAMGFKFENNDFKAMLRNPYLWGTGISQMRQLSRSAGFVWGIDRGTLAIWPKGGSRKGSAPTISPNKEGPGELIGYPVLSQRRIFATCYFDPQIKPFGQVNVESSLTAAQGLWNIAQIDISLDAWTPHGRWQMTVIADSPGNVPSSGSQ